MSCTIVRRRWPGQERTAASPGDSRGRQNPLAALHNPPQNAPVPDAPFDRTGPLVQELLELTARTTDRAAEDPFGNPVLLVALAISRRIEAGTLDDLAIGALIGHLRDAAFADRARRVADYVGGTDMAAHTAVLQDLAQRLLRPDPNDSPVRWAEYRALVERSRFAAVFTAHPTFALPTPVAHALAETASGRTTPAAGSHRPPRITLPEEFAQAGDAIANGRDAIDRFNAVLLSVARGAWPDRWTELDPRPVILSSWVGYDTDGRTDIGWWDTLRLRLEMKRRQLVRLHAQVAALPATVALSGRIAAALDAVGEQLDLCPVAPEPPQVAGFARVLVGRRDDALTSPAPLLPLFTQAIAAADDDEARQTLCVARAGLVSHGLALAHTHVRLNAAQIHNAVRQRLGIADAPEDPAHRRVLFAAMNTALDTVQPINVDFGALLAEQASAIRLMMTIAQIVKHVDGSAPVRFLIAETETGYTLLAALWLARLFGVERHIEISPLFETADALERGATVLEEALRSPHYRAYLQDTGRLALQFGYSDSGRYVGQLAASYLIERLRLKIGRDAGGARHRRRRGDPVRHARRERRPRRAPGLARRPAEIPVAHRVAPGAEPRRPQRARGIGVPGRRRLSAVRYAGARAGDDHRHRPSTPIIPRPDRSRTRSTPTPTSPPTSSPRCAPAWRRWWTTKATPRCWARSGRR